MAGSEDLRALMELTGIALLIVAAVVPFGAETARDRWAMWFPSFTMVCVGVMLIALS